MREAKKESMKEVKKELKLKQLKITKPNGNVIMREALEGVVESYKKKGWKVEEV